MLDSSTDHTTHLRLSGTLVGTAAADDLLVTLLALGWDSPVLAGPYADSLSLPSCALLRQSRETDGTFVATAIECEDEGDMPEDLHNAITDAGLHALWEIHGNGWMGPACVVYEAGQPPFGLSIDQDGQPLPATPGMDAGEHARRVATFQRLRTAPLLVGETTHAALASHPQHTGTP